MKKELLKYAAFFLMAITAVTFTACEKDSDDDEDSVSIVGAWTLESVSVDVTIDGKSFVDFLVSTGFFTEAEAQEEYNNMLSEMEDMSGTLELKEDGTYVAEFSDDNPEEDDTGTWELSSDGKTLTIDKGTEDEMVFEVLTLTKSTLNIKMSRTEEIESTTSTMEMTMTMNFTR